MMQHNQQNDLKKKKQKHAILLHELKCFDYFSGVGKMVLSQKEVNCGA